MCIPRDNSYMIVSMEDGVLHYGDYRFTGILRYPFLHTCRSFRRGCNTPPRIPLNQYGWFPTNYSYYRTCTCYYRRLIFLQRTKGKPHKAHNNMTPMVQWLMVSASRRSTWFGCSEISFIQLRADAFAWSSHSISFASSENVAYVSYLEPRIDFRTPNPERKTPMRSGCRFRT